MAKLRVQHRRPQNQARRRAPAQSADEREERRGGPLNLRSEPINEERRQVLEQVPAWARVLRTRQGPVIGVSMIAAVVALAAGGRVAGPAASGLILLVVGLAMWRADKREQRARRQMGRDH